MEHDEKLKLAETMRAYGGGFVKALAECIIRADRQNFSKLQSAFPEYFQKYGKDGPFQGNKNNKHNKHG